MRALLPSSATDVDLLEAYALPAGLSDQRPFVRCNMISTLDGAISVKGRSGPLGGPADHRVFQVLRSITDVVLVGAGTARAEGYGPARLSSDLRSQRQARGRSAVPPIALVTASGTLDWSSAFFTDAEERPLVFTTRERSQDLGRRAGGLAHVVAAGDTNVDVSSAVDDLGRRGYRSVLLEGGPGLNADVVRAGLLDELCLTMSPRLVAGTGARVFAGPELARPLRAQAVHLLEEDGFLFFRLAVTSTPEGA